MRDSIGATKAPGRRSGVAGTLLVLFLESFVGQVRGNHVFDFCLMYATGGKSLPSEVLTHFCGAPRPETLFEYSESRYVLSQDSKRLAVFCSADGLRHHLSRLSDRSGVRFFDGSVVVDAKIVDAVSALDPGAAFRSGFGDVNGNFCYGQFSDGDVDRIYSSTLGVYNLFFCRAAGLVALSNNPHMAAQALACHTGQKVAGNHLAFAWLISWGFVGEPCTPYHGVFRVPTNAAIHVDALNNVSVFRQNPHLYVREAEEDDGAALKRVHAQASQHVVAMAHADAASRVGQITGGFDSRLPLALAVEAGVHREFRFETFGNDAHPDVLAGKAIAALMSLDHQVRDPAAAPFSAEDYARDVKGWVYASAGTRELAETWGVGSSRFASARNKRAGRKKIFSLNGNGGEYYRGYYSHLLHERGQPNLPIAGNEQAFFQVAHCRAADVLRSEVGALLKEVLLHQVRLERQTYDLDRIFTANRMPQFHGGLYRRVAMAETDLSWPTFDPALHSLAFTGRAEDRAEQKLSFRLIEASCPALLKVPFANKAWDEATFRNRSDSAEFSALRPFRAEGPQLGPALSMVTRRMRAIETRACDPHPAVFEIFDRAKFDALIDKAFADETVAKRHVDVVNIAGMSLWFEMVDERFFSIGTGPICSALLPEDVDVVPHAKDERSQRVTDLIPLDVVIADRLMLLR